MYNPTYHAAIELKSILTKVAKEFDNLRTLAETENENYELKTSFILTENQIHSLLDITNRLTIENKPEEVLPVDPDRGIGEWLEERNSCSGCDDCNGDCG